MHFCRRLWIVCVVYVRFSGFPVFIFQTSDSAYIRYYIYIKYIIFFRQYSKAQRQQSENHKTKQINEHAQMRNNKL